MGRRWLPDEPDFASYRHRLPHWRLSRAVYFVTWRLGRRQIDLTEPERDVVAASLRFGDGSRYALLAYVVMNDHVHVLLAPSEGQELSPLLQSWKSFLAHDLVKRFGRVAPVWQDEYLDRIVRDDRELAETMAYIVANPSKRWPDMAEYRWALSIQPGDPRWAVLGG